MDKAGSPWLPVVRVESQGRIPVCQAELLRSNSTISGALELEHCNVGGKPQVACTPFGKVQPFICKVRLLVIGANNCANNGYLDRE